MRHRIQGAVKKGLILTKYGSRAASTRQRFGQMQPYLDAQGMETEIAPLLDDDYLDRLFDKGTRNFARVIKAYGRRLWGLLKKRDFDFLVVHCELFPYLPGWLEAVFFQRGKPVIFDFDDAIFHQYDSSRSRVVDFFIGNKLAPVLKQATLAVCGNAYLEQYARRYCAHTAIVPTTVDTDVYVPADSHSAPVTVGWMGSPSTWRYVAPVMPVLQDLVDRGLVQVLVVGSGQPARCAGGFEFRDWSQAREVADIQSMDIGIMPVPDEPWARGKCGYKLIQYMGCGRPVVASPVGVNREIVQTGVNGWLAESPQAWRGALEDLAAAPGRRETMGRAGRARVEAHYSLQVQGPRLAQLIAAAV